MINNSFKELFKETKKYGLQFLCLKVLNELGVDKRPEIRLCIEKYYSSIPPEEMLEELRTWFFEHVGYIPNIEEPKTFDEKMQWIKLYDSTPIKTRLSDKYLAREWVKEKIGEKYLIPLLGVWDKFDDIDFSQLPEEYVLQCNHGSIMNVIVRKGQPLDKKDAKKKFDTWQKIQYGLSTGFELHYSGIPRKIIATKYLKDITDDLPDYKVYCFGGKPTFIQMIVGRHDGASQAFMSTEWRMCGFYNAHYPLMTTLPAKPKQLDEMLNLCAKLAEGFNFVRVDWYLIGDSDIYFGEMTFTPASGTQKWIPQETDVKLGALLQLPKEKYIREKI